MNKQAVSETARRTRPPAPAPHFASAEQMVDHYERIEVAEHPLFVELAARPVDLGTIWILMANLQEGISREFVVWLAKTITRLDDRRVASLLAKQLNDELGAGDFTQIHSVLLRRFVTALERWRPPDADARTLEPGRRLARDGSKLFRSRNVHEALGALMVGEVFAKKMDHCVGNEIRRQQALSDSALTWLNLHEVLEADHADESRILAALVPDSTEAVSAAVRGAAAQWKFLWQFLDGVRNVSRSVALDSRS